MSAIPTPRQWCGTWAQAKPSPLVNDEGTRVVIEGNGNEQEDA